MRNKITKEHIILGASILAAIIVAYLLFFNPLIRTLNIKRSESRSIEGQLLEMHDTIRLAGNGTEGRVLLAERDASLAIDELTKHGKSMGINFISITPKEIIKSSDSQYKILPVEMVVEATDQQFSMFLGLLDALKKSVITVESFDVAPDKDNPAQVKATIIIDMYFSTAENTE